MRISLREDNQSFRSWWTKFTENMDKHFSNVEGKPFPGFATFEELNSYLGRFHNAKIHIEFGEFLEFETSEDATAFILMWS